MAITSTWQGGQTFLSENDQHHQMLLESGGGQDATGFSPMETVLSALAGCMGMNGITIMRPFSDQITDFKVIVSAERNEEPPKSFTDIYITFSVDGEVNSHKVWRALQLAEEKYCSVSNSLKAEKHLIVMMNGERIEEP